MNNLFKKISVYALSLAIATQLCVASVSHAQFAVIDAANLAANTTTAANASTQTLTTNVLNGIAWTVAKTAVQSITRSTVNWINSGFNGSPAFVSDLQGNLKYLGDAVADNFFQNLNQVAYDSTGFNITSPFQDQLQQKLRDEYYRTTGSWGLNYNLYQQSTDPKAFLNGDFNQGGFNAFFSASQNPANNPFGAYQIASNQLWAQIDAAGQQRKAELEWGKGFLPWRGPCASSNVSAGENAEAVTLSKAEKCPFNAVRTPGSVIESQLENSLGTGIRQLELADSINEIVGALMGQLVNQVLGSGGLLGTSQPSPGGGSSYINQATNPSQYTSVSASLASGVQQNITNDLTNLVAYRANWQAVLEAANTANARCSNVPDITNAIATANLNIARAGNAITKLTAIQTEIDTAISSTAIDKSTRITTAIADYQGYLSSPDIPSTADIAATSAESTTAASTTGSTSLLTKMQNYQTSCTP